MNFSFLEDCHQKWRDILVIGKTIERDSQKYHIIGMTLSDAARLYIIEPYGEPHINRKGICNQRRILKEQEENTRSYLHCSEFCIGGEPLMVQGGTGSPLRYSSEDYEAIQLFFDMIGAGWTIPEWLRNEDWNNLQLITLDIANIEQLPEYTPKTSITIKHNPIPVQHILEKTITLNVGKSHSFCFIDNHGDTVWCHINDVALIDVWKDTEEQFKNPQLTERFSPEELQQLKQQSYETLEENCPRGMYYIGIEYECSKDMSLTFYSKQFLSSRPERRQGSASLIFMRLRPDKTTGVHNLPLEGCVIQTPVPPDTVKIPAELFLYYEKTDEWVETV